MLGTGPIGRIQEYGRLAAAPGAAVWDFSQAFSDGGATAKHWFRPDAGTFQDTALTTAAASDGDPVGGWQNQNTAGDDVVQATTNAKPTLKLNIKNGMPVLRCDAGDYLQVTYAATLNQPFTVFAVAMLDPTAVDDDVAYHITDSVTGTQMWLRKNPFSTPDTWQIRTSAALAGDTADSNWNIWTAVFNGASSKIYINGTLQNSGNAGTDNPGGLTVGARLDGAAGWLGDIGDIAIVPGSLSAADLNQALAYLSTRWAITVAEVV